MQRARLRTLVCLTALLAAPAYSQRLPSPPHRDWLPKAPPLAKPTWAPISDPSNCTDITLPLGESSVSEERVSAMDSLSSGCRVGQGAPATPAHRSQNSRNVLLCLRRLTASCHTLHINLQPRSRRVGQPVTSADNPADRRWPPRMRWRGWRSARRGPTAQARTQPGAHGVPSADPAGQRPTHHG